VESIAAMLGGDITRKERGGRHQIQRLSSRPPSRAAAALR